MAYDAISVVPKQSCSKKLNIVPLVLMINDKAIIACYFLQHGISSLFHIFSLFLSPKGSSNISKNKHRSSDKQCYRNSGNIIEAVIRM